MAYQTCMHAIRTLPALCALLAAGCVTLYDPAAEQQEALRQRQQAAAQQERFDRINVRLETLQAEVDRLRADLDRRSAEQGRAGSAEMLAVRESIEDVNRRLAAESAARERDRKVILDSVSTMLKSSSAGRSSSSSTTRRPTTTARQGVLHKVESGETLSAIATAYKVSSSAILDANGLKNPNQLRVGQELVIPTP